MENNKQEIILKPELQEMWAKKDILDFDFKAINQKAKFINEKYVLGMLTRFGKQQKLKGVWIGIVIGFLTSVGIQFLIFLSNAGII